MAMPQLMLHCGAKTTTRNEVRNVQTPDPRLMGHSKRYASLPYEDMLQMIEGAIERRIGGKIIGEQYGLNMDGHQLFGTFTVDVGDKEKGLVIGFRSSHNRTFAAGVCGGTSVFVCDNLCFSGQAFTAVRKHTVNIVSDFADILDTGMTAIPLTFEKMNADYKIMKEVPVDERRGAEILGRNVYDKVLKPQQHSKAMEAWRGNLNDFGRSMWGVYNAATEGAKRGAANTVMSNRIKLHDWFCDELLTMGHTPASRSPLQTALGLEID